MISPSHREHPLVPTAAEFLPVPELLQEHRGQPWADRELQRFLEWREGTIRHNARTWRARARAAWRELALGHRGLGRREAIRDYLARAHAWEHLLRAYRRGRFPKPAREESAAMPEFAVTPEQQDAPPPELRVHDA